MEQPPKKTKLHNMRERFDWLEEQEGKYFCKYCCVNPALLRCVRENNREEFFTNKGVLKTADPGRKAESHSKLLSHFQAVDYYQVVNGQRRSVIDMMRDKALSEQAKKERDYDVFIKSYMKIALWLFNREIPHTGNFASLLDLVASFDEDLCNFGQTRDANATYRSTTTCTEFMELMAEVLDEEATVQLNISISTFGSWALMADETTMHGFSMLGIYARYFDITSEHKVVEEMIDCCAIESTKAVDLFEVVDNCLRIRGFDIKRLRCVSFDGAAVMSSPINGLYGIMKCRWALPNLIFQHCRAHRLQLVGRDAAKECHQAELALGTARSIYVFFHKSNKKLDLLRKITTSNPEFDGHMRKLIEVAPTRWLSYGHAIGRLLKIYVNISLSLESMQHSVTYTSDDRARSSGLLLSLLSRHILATLVFMDIILEKLTSLSCIFQDTETTLETAIKITRCKMSEIQRFCNREYVLQEIEPKVDAIAAKLQDAGLSLAPGIGNLSRLRSRGDYVDGLCNYTEKLLIEMEQRFNDDNEMLATMVPFYDEHWPNYILNVSRKFGFDEGLLMDESRNIKRHCEFLQASMCLNHNASNKAFWVSFLSDPYTRAMYPEHSSLAGMLLTMPLGSCAVERCFSYTNRISNDNRASLTGSHISALVRISQKGPSFPTIKEIKMPMDNDNDDEVNDFLRKVIVKWRMSPRRL